MTIVSGHQPAYLPWLGLIHKTSLSDVFIYMDDVQFLDRDFNHRNRVLTPDGKVLWLTVPVIRKQSPSLRLCDIRIAQNDWQQRHMLTLRSCYGKTAYFKQYWPFFEWLYAENTWTSLAELDLVIFRQVLEWFHLSPQVVIGSEQHFIGKKSDLVLEHALRYNAEIVVTGAMGAEYINGEDFDRHGVKLIHQQYNHPLYAQGRQSGVTHLSFVDLLFRFGDDARSIALSNNVHRDAL